MSNSLAIAAVTQTLRHLLMNGVAITDVTASPLDNARRSATGNQINLFLYQVLPNAAWRNQEMPRNSKPGETAHPPLALTLSYLVTAYSGDDNDTSSHALLGSAMRVFHDHPVLGATDVAEVNSPVDTSVVSDLKNHFENIRIVHQPLAFEEMSKLWTTFQTHYRVSASYQVSAVLIESQRKARTPLPVLQRGESDRGVLSQSDVVPRFPVLSSVQLPERRLSALAGDTIILKGSGLSGSVVHLSSSRLPNVPQPKTEAVDDTELKMTLPGNIAAGFYAIALGAPKGEPPPSGLPLAVAPVIATPLPMLVTRVGGTATIKLSCVVPVPVNETVSLLLGDYEVVAEPPGSPSLQVRKDFQFVIKTLRDGTFPVPLGVGLLTRLRVDSVDSEIIAPRRPQEPENTPLRFDESKKITIK